MIFYSLLERFGPFFDVFGPNSSLFGPFSQSFGPAYCIRELSYRNDTGGPKVFLVQKKTDENLDSL